MKRYPLFCIREHLCIPDRTLRPIYRVLTWSFNDTRAQFSESCADLEIYKLEV